jgi:hypothetical protein
MEDEVQGPNRLQGVSKYIKTMGWTLHTPSHLPDLRKEDLKEFKVIHDGKPPTSHGRVENPKKLFPKPFRCDTREQGSMMADCLGRGVVDGEIELGSEADAPEEAQGVLGEHLRIAHPDPPHLQVSEAPCGIDEVGRILPQGDAECIDREVPAPEVLDDIPPAERSNVYLHSLSSPGKHDPLDPLGEANQSSGKGVLEGCAQSSGFERDQVDVEALWALQQGVTHKAADEVDREQVPFRRDLSHLAQQWMISNPMEDAFDASVHRLTLREAEHGCQHGVVPLLAPKTA